MTRLVVPFEEMQMSAGLENGAGLLERPILPILTVGKYLFFPWRRDSHREFRRRGSSFEPANFGCAIALGAALKLRYLLQSIS